MPTTPILSDEEIVRLYRDERRPVHSIRAAPRRVRRVLAEHNVPRNLNRHVGRKRTIILDVDQLKAMQARGMSLGAIAAELGVSWSTVRRHIAPLPKHTCHRREPVKSRAWPDPSYKPATVTVPTWEQEVAAKRIDLPEPRPIYQGESRLRAKLNARRQEQGAAG